MPADTTLPGSIPGLLRRGGPVIKTWNHGDTDEFTARGIYLRDMEPDEAGRRCLCWFDIARIGQDVGFEPAIDLTDATGEFHALLWLAIMCGADEDDARTASLDHQELSADNLLGWLLWTSGGTVVHFFLASHNDAGDLDEDDYTVVLGLGGLGCDERIEALRLVCLHVAEVPDGR